MPDVMYLRKSRVDMELEARGEKDVLSRHEAELMRSAKLKGRVITSIYREVVTGDTIAARPVMQKLLAEVESGMWDAVHVVEIERLARGDTMDQGTVARAFRFSNTLIVTPSKTYDPDNEFDEEYFEFGLFMSRREYKAITRRQQRGRMASINEGKYVGNKTPYGYMRIKLVGQKGWTLEPETDKAEVVRSIFRWYTDGYVDDNGNKKQLGTSLIVRKLNESGIPSPGGQDWTNHAIQTILRNPVYAGWIRWGNRAQVKKIENGIVVTSRPRAAKEDIKLSKGLHVPLISQECFDAAQVRLALNPSRPGPKQYETKNPLSGLIICAKCGRTMVRRPYNNVRPDGLICLYTSCNTVSSTLDTVEAAVLDALTKWLKQFEYGDDNTDHDDNQEIQLLRKSLSSIQKDLDTVDEQTRRAYDLVEQGIYTTDVFLSRSKELTTRKTELVKKIVSIEDELTRRERVLSTRQQIVPNIRYVLDAYPTAATPEEKNRLLKSVLQNVIYSKSQGARWQESDMQLTIHPKVPQ